MSPQSVRVSADQTMEQAAAVFARHHITGAPVVDQDGRCVGVLSATDFVRHLTVPKVLRPAADSGQQPASTPNDPASATQMIGGDLVRSHMSEALQTVAAEAPLLTAARCMCAGHIHRLIVLADDDRPAGVVSSLDIVAALINAIDEGDARSYNRNPVKHTETEL